MILANIDPKAWIVAMFIRDDGERLLLGDGKYDFNADQLHYGADAMANDVVELQGTNGQVLAGQVRRSTAQDFSGFVGTGTNSKQEIEQWRREFLCFFATGHYFTAVYVACPEHEGDKNSAIARKRGYLTEAPEVRELYQVTPEYHVALAFEDVNYYQYAEDSEGNEIYANIETIDVSGAADGGLVWDNNGAVWDEATGMLWNGTITPETKDIYNDGVASCPIIWEIDGATTNPTLNNLSTGESMQFEGVVPSGSKLIIDTGAKTAKLDGQNVYEQFRGTWIQLKPNMNKLKYMAETTQPSTIKWNEVVG